MKYHPDTYHIRDYVHTDFEAVEALWKCTGIGASWRGDTHESIVNTLQKGGRFLVMMDTEKNRLAGTSLIKSIIFEYQNPLCNAHQSN